MIRWQCFSRRGSDHAIEVTSVFIAVPSASDWLRKVQQENHNVEGRLFLFTFTARIHNPASLSRRKPRRFRAWSYYTVNHETDRPAIDLTPATAHHADTSTTHSANTLKQNQPLSKTRELNDRAMSILQIAITSKGIPY